MKDDAWKKINAEWGGLRNGDEVVKFIFEIIGKIMIKLIYHQYCQLVKINNIGEINLNMQRIGTFLEHDYLVYPLVEKLLQCYYFSLHQIHSN